MTTILGDTRPVGSYIQREAVLELASVKEVVEELTADGYVLDGNSSDTRVKLGSTGTEFNLRYKKAEVTVTFVSDYGFSDGHEGNTVIGYYSPGDSLAVPKPKEVSGKVCVGWSKDESTDIVTPEIAPDASCTYTAVYEDQTLTVILDTGNHGSFAEGVTTSYELKHGDKYPEAPKEEVDFTVDANWVFTGWEPEYDKAGTVVEISSGADADSVTYTAQYAEDKNGDGKADSEQTEVTLRPYETTIYTGGVNDNNGFPELDLEAVFTTDIESGGTATRRVYNEAVTSVTINGYTFSDSDGEDISLDTFFDALYVYRNEAGRYVQAAHDSDQGLHQYIAVIAVKAAAIPAFDSGTYEVRDGYVYNTATDFYVTSGGELGGAVTIGVEADYSDIAGAEDFTDTSYIVNVDSNDTYVREVNEDEVYRDIVTSEAEITDDDQATAIVADGTSFYTNGDTNREVSSDGIQLLSDSIIDAAAEEALLSRAYAEAGNNSDEYEDLVRYFDLVDSYNGNAWVGTADGVTVKVYVPYSALSEAVDPDTIEVYHFEGLHRDGTNDGKIDVASAAGWGQVEEIKIEKAENGFYIETESFSPFIIMWKLNDNGEDNTPGDNTGDNTPGDNTGGNGGDSDSDGGSSSPGAGPGASGSTYTAGVDGHWVHMDPDNIMIPTSEDVPEGATPVTAPQWHQWKFILNNGMMLYDQWAYVKNPYAIGDQPDEGWFSFAENGIMEYGWYLDERTGKWYWMHRTSDGMLGTMLTGWHFDEQDGKWYYMSPRSGEMLLGWQEIDGKWYYFNPYAPAVTWEFNEATGGWIYNGANSRPYGSMYANETTPDGYAVGEDGAWIQ